jgi:hypothetical protein
LTVFSYDWLELPYDVNTVEEGFWLFQDWGLKIPSFGQGLTGDEVVSFLQSEPFDASEYIPTSGCLIAPHPRQGLLDDTGLCYQRPFGERVTGVMSSVDWTTRGHTVYPRIQLDDRDPLILSSVDGLDMCAIGDDITCRREGDQWMLHNIDQNNGGDRIDLPDTCPDCGSNLDLQNEVLVCKGSCREGSHHLSRWVRVMDMDAWMDVVSRFSGQTVSDLYEATEEDLSGCSNADASTLLQERRRSRFAPLSLMLSGLGVGSCEHTNDMVRYLRRTSSDIAIPQYLVRLSGLTPSDLSDIGFGDRDASSLTDRIDRSVNTMIELIMLGVCPTYHGPGSLDGLTLGLKDADPDLENLIESHGGSVVRSVGQGIDYVVTSDDRSPHDPWTLHPHDLFEMIDMEDTDEP